MELDLSKFVFPSDKITIGLLRKMHPHDFDAEMESCVNVFATSLGKSEGSTSRDMADMLYHERVYAGCSWGKANGDAPNQGWMEETAAELKELYVKYGLASGPKHAEQLLRSIDSQAKAMVKNRPGP